MAKAGKSTLTPRLARLLEQGQSFERSGALPEAERCYQGVLREAPAAPEALNALGLLVQRAGRQDLALRHLERAAKAERAPGPFRNNLASLLVDMGQPGKAIAHLKRVLARNPRLHAARMNLGRALRATGDAAAAVAAFERVLAAAPDFPGARQMLADAWLDIGRPDKAEPLLRAVLEDDPNDAQSLSAIAALTRNGSDLMLAAIERALPQQTVPRERAILHFSAGRLQERQGEFAKAFVEFQAGNELLRLPVNFAALERFVEACEARLTAAFFDDRAAQGHPSNQPVFIVGMPRSGTTLVEQMLASHSAVAGGGELRAIGDLNRELLAGPGVSLTAQVEALAALPAERIGAAARQYFGVLRRLAGGSRRVTDKMPHNFMALGLIALLFPKACIVHCRRSPMDTCLSCFTTPFNERHAYACDLTDLGRYYRLYARLMTHWHQVLGARLHAMDYEALVAQPEAKLRGLLDFLGLDWEQGCLDFHLTERVVATPSRNQVRQPLYGSSVGRWRRYAAHLQPLREALGPLADPA